jgi:hypothetical protein
MEENFVLFKPLSHIRNLLPIELPTYSSSNGLYWKKT